MNVKNTYPKIIQVVGGTAPNFPILNTMVQIDPASSVIGALNANPYLIGVFYLFLNLGGRFISLEMTKKQEMFMANPFLRPFILFCVMFISTRNLAVAFWTTLGILAVLRVFANENSEFCLIPGWRETSVKPDEKDSYNHIMDKINKHPHSDMEDSHHEVELNPDIRNTNAPNHHNEDANAVENYDDYDTEPN